MVSVGDVLGAPLKNHGAEFLGEVPGERFVFGNRPLKGANDPDIPIVGGNHLVFAWIFEILNLVDERQLAMKLIFPKGFAGIGHLGMVGVLNEQHRLVFIPKITSLAVGGIALIDAGLADGGGDLGDDIKTLEPSVTDAPRAKAGTDDH